MKIWFDSERPTEEGWTHCESLNELITFLNLIPKESVDEVNLTYRMGRNTSFGGDGEALLFWMEEEDWWPKKISLHGEDKADLKHLEDFIKRYGEYSRRVGLHSWVKL